MNFKATRLFFIVFVPILSCTNDLQEESSEYINKTLRLDIFSSISHCGNFNSFEEFRNKYDYISLVFLKKGCKPCELKISEWQKNHNKIKAYKNYTVLFIFQGFELKEIEHLKSNLKYEFNFVHDIHCRYLTYNKDIPYSVLDSSVLINGENKIKFIGSFFVTTTNFEQFKSIIKE